MSRFFEVSSWVGWEWSAMWVEFAESFGEEVPTRLKPWEVWQCLAMLDCLVGLFVSDVERWSQDCLAMAKTRLGTKKLENVMEKSLLKWRKRFRAMENKLSFWGSSSSGRSAEESGVILHHLLNPTSIVAKPNLSRLHDHLNLVTCRFTSLTDAPQSIFFLSASPSLDGDYPKGILQQQCQKWRKTHWQIKCRAKMRKNISRIALLTRTELNTRDDYHKAPREMSQAADEEASGAKSEREIQEI